MRLEKLLDNMGFGSRKDVKSMLKKKQVTVNEVIKRDGSMHVDPSSDVVVVNGEVVHYQKYIYVMLNKAPGYISATEDMREKTVIDLLPANIRYFKTFPVWCLDKDTEVLLFFTYDRELVYQ